MGIARTAAAIAGGFAIGALSMASAQAAVINTVFNAPLTTVPVSFALGSGAGTISFTAVTTDVGPGAAVATNGTVQATTIFGQVADYGSATVFDGTASFASFSSPATIQYSAADDFIGLSYTAADGVHLGYAEVFGSNLIGIAYESAANTSITGVSLLSTSVPEPASLAVLASGMAVIGLARRAKRSATRHELAA